ncbi:Ger(x)C family spore germination protein [Lentibacillus sp. CBA3610]|uniref:Ger(x)C family spore germination protein n=1 Tax=Lentibacillus sp. CBA3610 TaxID=2518176 RepID=UPI0015963124|nr:Ger(x)C family spore germination protein [Lentibacillus sp. CBA3610]QKY71446.1 Ger(x)C family spore germination protein [Lentibacillus sp. CBA3610]
MMKRKGLHLVAYMLIIVVLSGCWDRVEIEDRGFIIGSAIDSPEDSGADENAVTMTNQFVVPSGLGGPSQGSPDKQAFANITARGKSLFAIQREMATLSSRSPFFPHLQTIAVSSELAQQGNLFSDVMDLFLRDHEMRREVDVVIVDGKAKDILDIQPENEQLPVMHIQSIMENSYKNAGTLQPLRIGELHEHLLNNSSYVIPRMVKSGDALDYEGIGVFHGNSNRMVGTLNQQETRGYILITGEKDGGKVEVEMDDETVTLEIMNISSSMTITNKSKANIGVDVNTDVEALVAETFGQGRLTSKEKLKDLEQKAEAKMESLMKQAIDKVQGELKTDVLGVNHVLNQYHYDFWKGIEEDWDHGQNYFADASIDVSASVNIQSSGSVDQTKN